MLLELFCKRSEQYLECEKEINKVKGICKIKVWDVDDAEGIAESSYSNIRKFPTWILRTENGAELWREEGKVVSGGEILDEIYSWKE